MLTVDESTPPGAYAAERLAAEVMAWITTVRGDGQPQSSGVWFHWNGTDLLVMSEPGAQKIRNIRTNPRVSLHLDGDGKGRGLVIADGTARLLPEGAAAERVGPYLAKYDQHMRERLGWNPEQMTARFSSAVVIAPTRWRVYP